MIRKVTKARVVSVDITYDHTTYAIVDVLGHIIAEDMLLTANYPNVNEFVKVLSDKIVELVEANGGYDTIRSVGISTPSGNFETGCIENSPNLPWKGVVPLAAMLRDRLGLAVALANNAHARALGEYTFGCAHGLDDFIFVTLGNGLGSCMMSGGKTLLGCHGFSGEVGHSCVEPGGRPCACGGHGCLEAYVSTRGVLKTASELLEGTDKPSLMRGKEELSLDYIKECADAGDELAIETLRRTGEILGVAMANYASIYSPEAIVFSGRLLKAGKWLLDPLNEVFEQNVFSNIKGKVSLMESTLNDEDRDVMGASVLAWKVKEYSLFK